MVAILVGPLRGLREIEKTVNPRKARKAMNDALDVAVDHYVLAMQGFSRVKTDTYRPAWRRGGGRGHRTLRNDVKYATYVTGSFQQSTPHRGAATSFWGLVRRREGRDVKAKMIRTFMRGIRS